MPFKMKGLRIGVYSNAIKKYLEQAKTDEQTALAELIYDYINNNHHDLFIEQRLKNPVHLLRPFCSSMDHSERSNYLWALTEYCFNKTIHKSIKQVLSYSPEQMIATFHKAASRFSDTKPIALRINLSSFIAMPKAYKSVLKFCLITFVPTLIITEKFADNSTLLSGFNELIDSLSAPPMIIYDQSCPLNQMNSEEMAVFLKSIRKASTLILNGSCLDHWNPSELEQLIDAIKENPNLISLDLKQTQLNTWYIDSEKFPWLLELIKLEQLTRLDLPPYHERELPASHLEQLQWTIRMRHYRHTPVYEHIVAPKTSGLFNKKSPKLDPCTAVFGCEKSPAR